MAADVESVSCSTLLTPWRIWSHSETLQRAVLCWWCLLLDGGPDSERLSHASGSKKGFVSSE